MLKARLKVAFVTLALCAGAAAFFIWPEVSENCQMAQLQSPTTSFVRACLGVYSPDVDSYLYRWQTEIQNYFRQLRSTINKSNSSSTNPRPPRQVECVLSKQITPGVVVPDPIQRTWVDAIADCQALCRKLMLEAPLPDAGYRLSNLLTSVAPEEDCKTPKPTSGLCSHYACRYDLRGTGIPLPCDVALKPQWLPGMCQ